MDLDKIKEYFVKYSALVFVVFLALLFFVATSSYNWLNHDYAETAEEIDFVKWGSPDETANYIFTKLYAQTGELSIFEKYNLYTNEIMHPRSMRSDHGKIKPVSFLGIILIYGNIAKVFGYKIIPYLTPLFAAIGILFFYLLIKALFNQNIALISASFLAVFPPYVYYTARSMFHNVLLIVLLLMGLYFGYLMISQTPIKKTKRKNKIWGANWLGILFSCLAGLFFGLAIITRTSELLWIAPALFILWIFNIRRIGVTKLLLFIVSVVIALVPAAYYNHILFGSPYFGGYTEMNNSIVNITNAGTNLVAKTETGNIIFQKDKIMTIINNVFPWGIHFKQSLKMFEYYFVKMFPVLFYLGIIGFIIRLFEIKKWEKKHWAYLISLGISAFVLILYYGSWKFNDNPDPNSYTIGNSYTRYWLIIYMGVIPIAAYFIDKVACFISEKIFNKFDDDESEKFFTWSFWKGFTKFMLSSLVVIFVFFISIKFVMIGSEEGLLFTIGKNESARLEWQKVLTLTEHNSTIITKYHDKIFFPERKVINGEFNDKEMVAQYVNLAEYLPLYYYNFTLPEESLSWLNERRLGEVGLKIKEIEKVTDSFTLYKLYLE